MPLKAAEEVLDDKNSRRRCRTSWFITVFADLKSAVTTAVQLLHKWS
jgi:hypothetical protein